VSALAPQEADTWERPDPAAASRPGRKSERTRKRVLGAAKQLFDRRGYRDTTIDDITRRAKIAHGTFYLYFRGKSDVLKELLEQTFEEFDAIASREPLSEADIAGLVRLSLLTYQRNQLLMRLLREASASDPHFRSHYDAVFVGRLVDHLETSIDHLQQTLPAAGAIKSRVAARALVGMIESFAYGLFIGGEDYEMEDAVETLTQFCARALGI
jgi:AcrR family transcriptional regulator